MICRRRNLQKKGRKARWRIKARSARLEAEADVHLEDAEADEVVGHARLHPPTSPHASLAQGSNTAFASSPPLTGHLLARPPQMLPQTRLPKARPPQTRPSKTPPRTRALQFSGSLI